jgi:hypothetical protein
LFQLIRFFVVLGDVLGCLDYGYNYVNTKEPVTPNRCIEICRCQAFNGVADPAIHRQTMKEEHGRQRRIPLAWLIPSLRHTGPVPYQASLRQHLRIVINGPVLLKAALRIDESARLHHPHRLVSVPTLR